MFYINIILSVLVQEIGEELNYQQQYDYAFESWLCLNDYSDRY